MTNPNPIRNISPRMENCAGCVQLSASRDGKYLFKWQVALWKFCQSVHQLDNILNHGPSPNAICNPCVVLAYSLPSANPNLNLNAKLTE